MPLIDTSLITPEAMPAAKRQVYNGLDCMLTLEIFEEIQRLTNAEPLAYNFARALQGPILEIMLRGFAVDKNERAQALHKLKSRMARLQTQLDRLAFAVWDKPLNPRSSVQLQSFFYRSMAIPEIWTSKKGERKLSMDRDTLEKLDLHLFARPIVATILAIRGVAKQIEVLETEVSSDGRMRTSYNIGGTETGRLSSSAASDGTGSNLQNIEPALRRMFIADPGMVLVVIDLEQAESREVGWLCGTLFGDWTYLDACEDGDLHTTTCRLIWPNLSWTKDPKANKALAEQNFYRHYSYRDMSKRGGHGCLTADHEVLTRNGWVSITDKPQEILIWNEHKSYFAPVVQWTDFSYTGQVHSFEGNSMSSRMTADHRIPYKKDQAGRWYERQAKDGPGKLMPLGANYVGGTEVVPARLIAAFMADGHQKSTNRMEFHFKKERKISRLMTLCEQYGFKYEDHCPKITVHGALPKTPGPFQLNWTKECIEDFLDELKYWDGHIGPTSVSLFSVHKEHLEWLKTLGRICGIGGNIQLPRKSGFGSTVYSLQQNNRQYANGPSLAWTQKAEENIRMLCPTVETGFFYVRRNNRIFVTGNSNYFGKPFTMARHLKVPASLMSDFQARYFGAFPAIPKWHRWTAEQLQTTSILTTPWGRERQFFGRATDDTTLREAIAYIPQSCTADRTNLGLLRIWQSMPQVQLLAQTHDSVTFQCPHQIVDEVVPAALACMEIPIHSAAAGRTMIVPGEAKVGFNWAYYNEKTNPNGLRKWKPGLPLARMDSLSHPLG